MKKGGLACPIIAQPTSVEAPQDLWKVPMVYVAPFLFLFGSAIAAADILVIQSGYRKWNQMSLICLLTCCHFYVAYANVIETSQQRFTSDVVPVFKIVSIFIRIVICKCQSKTFDNPLLLELGWHYYRDPKHRH